MDWKSISAVQEIQKKSWHPGKDVAAEFAHSDELRTSCHAPYCFLSYSEDAPSTLHTTVTKVASEVLLIAFHAFDFCCFFLISHTSNSLCWNRSMLGLCMSVEWSVMQAVSEPLIENHGSTNLDGISTAQVLTLVILSLLYNVQIIWRLLRQTRALILG